MSTFPVVTRFAPGPSGELHLGNARTALFNFLPAGRWIEFDALVHGPQRLNSVAEMRA